MKMLSNAYCQEEPSQNVPSQMHIILQGYKDGYSQEVFFWKVFYLTVVIQ